jgi:outer membrane receptor protein involved in Fe transport
LAAFPQVAIDVGNTNGGYLLPSAMGSGQSADSWNVETESLSLFTHDEISITDRLLLTVGLRYNQDRKDLDANLLATSTSCLTLQQMEAATLASAPGPGGIVSIIQGSSANGSVAMNAACNPALNPISNGHWTGDREENEWSGTASLSYDITDDVMAFASYSRGYKAGGYNIDRQGFAVTPATISAAGLNTSQLAFEPEFTDAYELGVKSTLFGNTTVNLSAFLQQIHDYQLNAFNGFNFITRNIPEVISQGAELEVASRVTDRLTLGGGLVYTDAHYDSTVVFNTLDPVPNTVSAGTPLTFAPEWVATGSIAYEMPVTSDLNASFYLDARWNSEYRTQTLNRHPGGATDNQAFALFNGRIGIGPEDERWSVEFWGQNLTDEFYFVGAFSPPLQGNTFVAFPNEPRTYGVTVRARY